MVNFRYHLVSLTAVFLALALGIAVGAGAVRQGTVDVLNRRLDSVEQNVKRTNSQNDQLRKELADWQHFSDQAGKRLIAGRLKGVNVLLVGVRGIDTKAVETLAANLLDAGAAFEGTVWFTAKFKLGKADEVLALANVLGISATKPDAVREQALFQLAAAWANGDAPSLMVPLQQAGFLEFVPPTAGQVDLAGIPSRNSSFVVASGVNASVSNDLLAVPFVNRLASLVPNHMEAVETTADVGAPSTASRPPFVSALRGGSKPTGKISTVDDIDTFQGRIAAVLALDDLTTGRTGNYGIGPGVDGLAPSASG